MKRWLILRHLHQRARELEDWAARELIPALGHSDRYDEVAHVALPWGLGTLDVWPRRPEGPGARATKRVMQLFPSRIEAYAELEFGTDDWVPVLLPHLERLRKALV